MQMIGTNDIQDYLDLKAAHPDIVLGSETDNPITLARVCVQCEGTGRGAIHQCLTCGGSGMVVTEAGEAIRKLVRL